MIEIAGELIPDVHGALVARLGDRYAAGDATRFRRRGLAHWFAFGGVGLASSSAFVRATIRPSSSRR